jgi:hypothetical protein
MAFQHGIGSGHVGTIGFVELPSTLFFLASPHWQFEHRDFDHRFDGLGYLDPAPTLESCR